MGALPRFAAFTTFLVAVILQSAPAWAQATRTWVSGVGDDVNPCSRTAPCKTFAGAISKTASNGIINCLDPGGFGAITITKPITLDCTGTLGGILAAGTNGVIISTTGSVTLRGLSIEGGGTGFIGVRVTAGASVHVENCQIFGFNSGTAAGVLFDSGTGGELFIANSTITENGTGITGGGVLIRPTGGGVKVAINRTNVTNNANGITADTSTGAVTLQVVDALVSGNTGTAVVARGGSSVFLDHVTAAANDTGVLADGAGAQILVTNSTITGNARGVNMTNGGFVYSYVTNSLNLNNVDGSFAASLSQR